MKFTKAILLFLFILVVGNIMGQTISVTVTVLPPYDPNLFVYTEDEDKVLITLTNNSASNQSIKLGGVFHSMDESVRVSTSSSYQPQTPITLMPGETRMLNSSELYSIFPDENSIDAVGITREELIRTRRLPNNTYQLCITAYDYNASGYSVPLSNLAPAGCSAPFRVALISAPQMISFGGTSCGGTLTPLDIQGYNIMWMTPPEVPTGMRYVVEMIELYPQDRNPFDAFESATSPIFFSDSLENTNTYFYSMVNPMMEAGQAYAVRVRVVDPEGNLRFANNGYSAPCVIRYGTGTSGRFTLESAFPSGGEYIPWRYFPVTVKFAPYDNLLFRFNYNFNMTQNGVALPIKSDELRWPWGPAESQTRATGMTIVEDASRYLPVNESNALAEHQFLRGATYQYTVDGSFLHRNTGESNPLNVSTSDGFISGMGVPVNKQPANNSNVEPGAIRFLFQTAEFPTNPLPSFAIVSGGTSRVPASNFYNQGISERYLFEVSRFADFNTVLNTISNKFSPNVDLNACISDRNLLNDSVYRDINLSLSFRDTGNYYWRIKWLADDNNENSQAYVTGPTWRFRIPGEGEEIIIDSIRRTPASCLADCAAAPVTDRTPTSTAAVGNTIRVGKFDMILTEITWSGSNARGRGHIRVPFMNAPVRVSFSGIQINAGNALISGDVFTETDNTTLVPETVARAVGVFTGVGEGQAEEINEWLVTSNRLVSQLAGSEPVGMPLGIDNTIDGQRLTIGIMGCKFTSSMATLNALVSLDIPELQGWLSLGANDICFHPGGLNMGQGKLYLPLDKQLGYTDDIHMTLNAPRLPRDSGTYVSWDCSGFKELAISGSVSFARSMLVPDNTDGSIGSGQVQARFSVKVQRLGNWICRLDMDPFQVAGLAEWGFDVSEAYLDFSDLQNAASMAYPEGYGGDRSAMWRGFYMKRLAVRLPHQFRTFNDPTRRLSASINNVLIDGTGFSARFAVENIVRVEEGNLDGWAFSLDTVYLSMVSNDFRNAGLAGEIRLPISDRDELKYNASLNRTSAGDFAFEFRIRPKDTFKASIWEIDLRLDPTSRIQIDVNAEGIQAGADLSGMLSMSGSRGGDGGARLDGISLIGIHFEHFRVNSRGPNYISVGHIARASDQHSAGGFPIAITNFNITNRAGPSMMEFDQSPGARFGLELTISLSLTGESSGFRATGKIAFLGKLNLAGERQGWTFSGVNLDSIAITGTVGCVTINGALAFYNSHPVFGKGIKGYLSITVQPMISAAATVQFGEVNGYRYWYADLMVSWSPGVTLFTGVDLRGIGGGAWYHMRKPAPVPFSSLVGTRGPNSNEAGATCTGTSYVPDRSVGLGFEARIKIGATGGSSAYHGLITLGAEFTEATGGIRRIFLTGDFIFMTESDNRREASASADFHVEYDFENRTFQANFSVYVNVMNVLVGVNEDNLAGRMEILVSPTTWHVYVGQPTVPVGLRLQIGSTRIAEARFYLMVGEDLPPMPPLPDKIAEHVHVTRIERDVTNLERGDGFAMGTSLDIGPIDLRIMPFYTHIELGFGFDLSVKKYTTRCEGMAPGETMGADGWYARGQIYGYFSGSMGLFVDLGFVSGSFEIFKVSAGAYLQGGFPNPNWVEGAITGSYSILNGAVSGNCHFEFSQGQKCVPPIENPMAGTELVVSMSPEHNATNVDCGVEPTALYSQSLEQEFNLTVYDMNDNPIVRKFRVLHANTKLYKSSPSDLIGGNLYASEHNTLLTFSPDSFLASRTIHNWTTTAQVEEQKDGVWATARDLRGTAITKVYTNRFTTAARPDRIREQDVNYSYPYHNQRFFLQNECRQGVLSLKRSAAYLFSRRSPGCVWSYKVRFTPNNGGEPIWGELRNINTENILFDVPTLLNQTIYQVDIVAIKSVLVSYNLGRGMLSNTSLKLAPTVKSAITSKSFGNSTMNVDKKTTVSGGKSSDEMVILYTYHFKTSQFNDIVTKFNSLVPVETRKIAWGDLESINQAFTGEGFDKYDVEPYTYASGGATLTKNPLVTFTSAWTPRTNTWMERQQYGTYGFRDWLQTERFGNNTFRTRRYATPPFGPVSFSDDYRPISLLSPTEINPLPPATASGVRPIAWPSSSLLRDAGSPKNTRSTTTTVPQIKIFYGVPTQTVLNRMESRNMARAVVAIYGLWGSEFLTDPQIQYLDYVLNEPYVRLIWGNYPVNVWYIPPTCGLIVDGNYSHRFNIVLPAR